MAASETAKDLKEKPAEASSSHSGIPRAVFVEDVEAFMRDPANPSAEVVIKRFDEQYQKYSFMEENLVQKRKRLRTQIPDHFQKSLDMIKFLKSKQGSEEPITTDFMLADNVYATAEIPPAGTVLLWLGANVMMEYPIDDAAELLESNLANAKKSLEQVENDLDFLKDQCTTMEVGMARVYNWEVQNKRKQAHPSTAASS